MVQRYDSLLDLGWDPRAFLRRCDTYYRIMERDTGKFHFLGALMRQRPAQMQIAQTIISGIIAGGRRRFILCKCRQIGASTFLCALHADIAAHVPGFQGAALSHTDEGTRVLWTITDGLLSRAPEGREGDENSRNLIVFDQPVPDFGLASPGEKSSITFRTARGFAPMTGTTLRFVHLNEFGKLRLPRDRAAQLMTSVLNAIPPQGPSVVIMESTAQGVGNLFHDTWQDAEKNARGGRTPAEGEWCPIFCPTYNDPGYRQRVEPGFNWGDWPADDQVRENALCREFNVDLEYLRWRRSKIQETRFDFARYNEEYPDRAHDAFMATTQGIVSQMYIDRARAHCKPAASYGWTNEAHDAPFGSDAIHIRGRGSQDLEGA